jgi:hypothetical protein
MTTEQETVMTRNEIQNLIAAKLDHYATATEYAQKDMDDQAKQFYGFDSHIAFLNSMGSHLRLSEPGMAVMQILSDCQMELEMNKGSEEAAEVARQWMNKAKWITSHFLMPIIKTQVTHQEETRHAYHRNPDRHPRLNARRSG